MSALQYLVAQFGKWAVVKLAGNLILLVREGLHHTNVEVPKQLLRLVRQAHSGKPEDMVWDIEVSPEMRDALCLPLTAQQLAQMRAAEQGVYRTSVLGYVYSSTFKNNALSGVVQVCVTVRSRYSKSELAYPPVKLRIVVSLKEGSAAQRRWEVTSVEQIA